MALRERYAFWWYISTISTYPKEKLKKFSSFFIIFIHHCPKETESHFLWGHRPWTLFASTIGHRFLWMSSVFCTFESCCLVEVSDISSLMSKTVSWIDHWPMTYTDQRSGRSLIIGKFRDRWIRPAADMLLFWRSTALYCAHEGLQAHHPVDWQKGQRVELESFEQKARTSQI